jgi:hypothetical protein
MKIKDIHLLAFYVTKPRDPKMTKVRGYMSDPNNLRYDERVEFTKGLNAKDGLYAKVILNLNTKQVVKNSWNTERGFNEYFKYFLEAYPKYVINVMGQLDMPYLEQFIPKEEPAEGITDVEAKDAEVKAE